MSEAKRCKTCKQPYSSHLSYVLESWDAVAPDRYTVANKLLKQTELCNRFVLMNNLELLEWEYEKSLNETPTNNNLR